MLPGLVDCHTHLVPDGNERGLERTATMGAEEVDRVIVESLRAQAGDLAMDPSLLSAPRQVLVRGVPVDLS